MTINKVNNYIPGQNITNLANNVDYNRLGMDQTIIEVDFTGSPAQVTIKQGSIIEVNGNKYIVQGADYVFTMAGATDNYITFNETIPSFSSTTIKGTYDNAKAGVYQADNVTRTICWYVNQSDEIYGRDMSLMYPNTGELTTEMNGYRVDTDPATAFLLYGYDIDYAINPSGDEFLDILVKKPITLVLFGNQDPGASHFVQIKIYGLFNSAVETFPIETIDCSVGTSRDTETAYVTLNPGQYRITLYWNINGFEDTGEIKVYMIGVYGQTNFDAVSVYV